MSESEPGLEESFSVEEGIKLNFELIKVVDEDSVDEYCIFDSERVVGCYSNSDFSVINFAKGIITYSNEVKIPNYSQISHTKWIYALHVVPELCFLFTGSSDRSVKLWGIQANENNSEEDISLQYIRTLRGHSNIVFSISMLDDTHVATGGQDHNLLIWDLTDGKRIKSCRLAGTPRNITPLPRSNGSEKLLALFCEVREKVGRAILFQCLSIMNWETGLVTKQIRFRCRSIIQTCRYAGYDSCFLIPNDNNAENSGSRTTVYKGNKVRRSEDGILLVDASLSGGNQIEDYTIQRFCCGSINFKIDYETDHIKDVHPIGHNHVFVVIDIGVDKDNNGSKQFCYQVWNIQRNRMVKEWRLTFDEEGKSPGTFFFQNFKFMKGSDLLVFRNRESIYLARMKGVRELNIEDIDEPERIEYVFQVLNVQKFVINVKFSSVEISVSRVMLMLL